IPLHLQVPLRMREKIHIFGTDYDTRDGTCIRDYIHVRDLAQAHLLAMEKSAEGYSDYNIGNGSGYTVREVVESARRITGHEIPAVEAPRRAGDPPALVGSCEKLKRELGYKPEIVEIDDIVASAWEWHKRFPSGYEG
ncbi:UDP-glucose 4-epimerase, partial [bacterium]|nr:UDP-glucose 4-epimerase [bacterium]